MTTLKYYLGMSEGDVSNNNYHLRFCEGVRVSEVRFDFVEKMYSLVRVISQAIRHQQF